MIIPRGADNTVAIDLIVQHIKSKLNNGTDNKHSKMATKSPLTKHIMYVGRDISPPAFEYDKGSITEAPMLEQAKLTRSCEDVTEVFTIDDDKT